MAVVSSFDFLNPKTADMKLHKWVFWMFGVFGFCLFVMFYEACVSSTDNTQQSETINEPSATQNEINQTSPINNKQVDIFKNNLLKDFSLDKDTVPYFPFKNTGFTFYEGFTAKSKNKKNNVQFQFFAFNKNNLCEKAGQKFLNSLGDAAKIKTGKRMKYLKQSPIFCINNQRNIILMRYTCENDLPKETISQLKATLKAQFSTEESTVLNIECGGPLDWL